MSRRKRNESNNESQPLRIISGIPVRIKNGEVFVFDSWTQFRETEEILPSIGEHILAERLDMACKAIIFITDGEDEFHLSDIRIRDSRFHTDDPIAKEYETLIKFENVKNTQNRKNNPALQKKTLPSGD